MKYCKQCGAQLEDSGKFCRSCGAEVATDVQSEKVSVQPVPAPAKQPMSKKNKRLLISAVIAIVVLFAAYKTGEFLTSKDRLINNFEKALIAKDSSKIAGLLSSSNKKLVINKNSVQALIKYFDKNPESENQLFTDLQSESSFLDQLNGNAYTGQTDANLSKNNFVNLKPAGKFLFFDTYKLETGTVNITLKTTFNNTDLFVDGKQVGSSNKMYFEKTYGPFIPGIHTTEAKYNKYHINLKTKDSVEVTSGTKTDGLVLDGQMVTVDIPTGKGSKTAKLFINGEDTGVNLFDDPDYGPVKTDGSMKMSVEATYPWGTVKSPEVPINDRDMSVNTLTDQMESEAMNIVNKDLDEELDAETSNDLSKLTLADDNYKSEMQDEIASFRGDCYSLYKASHTYTKFDLASFNLSYDGEKWIITVDAEVGIYDGQYLDSQQPFLQDDPRSDEFLLAYDNSSKKWLVDSSEGISSIGQSHVKQITNQNPKSYSYDPNM